MILLKGGSSVEHDAMQNVFVVFGLEVVANFVNFVVQVGSFRQHGDEVADEEGACHSFLVIVLNVDVDNVHGDVAGAFSVFQKFNYLVVNSLLASYDHVELLGACLKLFRRLFYSSVAVKHVQEPVLCVAASESDC